MILTAAGVLANHSHMLAASADLIDMIHNQSDSSDPCGGACKDIAFMVCPRAGVYRVWVQFQRGVS